MPPEKAVCKIKKNIMKWIMDLKNNLCMIENYEKE